MTDWSTVFGPEYLKINTVFERDGKGVIIPGHPATPEIAYLWDSDWHWDEKVDGTCIRLHWNGERTCIGGREDNAQLPSQLVAALAPFTEPALWREAFPAADDVTVYGEGYGSDIQGLAVPYRAEPSLIVFDVKIGSWWLSRDNVADIAGKLGLDVVPHYMTGTIAQAWELTANGALTSKWPGVTIEGLVGRPVADLYTRKGERVMAKMKVRDQAAYLRSLEPKNSGKRGRQHASPTGRSEGPPPRMHSFNPDLERAVESGVIPSGGNGGQGGMAYGAGARGGNGGAGGDVVLVPPPQFLPPGPVSGAIDAFLNNLSTGITRERPSHLDAEVTRGIEEVLLTPGDGA